MNEIHNALRNLFTSFVLSVIILFLVGCSPEPIPPSPMVSTVPEHNASEPVTTVDNLNHTEAKPIIVQSNLKKDPSKKIVDKTAKKVRAIVSNEIKNEEENLTVDTETLNNLVLSNQTRAVRTLLDQSPEAVHKIASKERKIYYLGPSGWRVIDLIEGFRNKELNEKAVIARIKSVKAPYKRFSYNEIRFLASQKIPLRVINAMIHVTP